MDDSDYDYTQGSLSEEVKALLDKRDADLASKKELASPIETNEGRSSPMTVLQAGEFHRGSQVMESTGDTKDVSDKPGQRRYISITETLEENRKLKAEVYNLKTDIFILKRELPALKDKKGLDFTQEFLKCKNQLYEEQKAKKQLEVELKGAAKQLEDLRINFETEQKKWDIERKALVGQQNNLHERLEEITKDAETQGRALVRAREELRDLQSTSTCESDVSQSGNSTLSLFSEREVQVEELRGLVIRITAEAETARQQFRKQIENLVADTEQKTEEMKALAENLESEKEHCRAMEAEISRIQALLEESEKEKGQTKKECEGSKKQYEMELSRRDKAINALIRRFRTANLVNISEGQTGVEGSDTAIIPAVANILQHVQEIDEKNIKIREKAIEIATADGSFEDPTASSGILSTDDEASDLSITQVMKKNEKIAKYISSALLKDRQNMDVSVREEVERKMAEFDAIEVEDPVEKEQLSTSQILNISAPNDLLNVSRCISQEVATLKRKVTAFRSICVRLFEKLRGSAGSLQKILVELCGDEEGKTLLGEVDALRIDLDQSINVADSLFNDFEAFQKNVLEFTEVFERSVRQQLYNSLGHIESSAPGIVEDASGEADYLAVEGLLETERQKVVDAEKRVQELVDKLSALNEENKKLVTECETADKYVAELNARVDLASAERDEFSRECERHEQKISEYRRTEMDLTGQVQALKQELRGKEKEFAQYKLYFEDLTRVEAESRKLVQSLKETIGSIPRRVVEVISGKAKTKEEDPEFSNQVLYADGHVIELRNEYAQMRLAIKESESKSARLEAELDRLVKETELLRKYKDEYARQLDVIEARTRNLRSSSTQTDLNAIDFVRREAEYERCIMENGASKENVERLCSAITSLEKDRNEQPGTVSHDVATSSLESYRLSPFPGELSKKRWQRIYERSNELVQLLKNCSSSNFTTELAEKALDKSRTLRAKIFAVIDRVSQLENIKENFNPNLPEKELREEVLSLQLALSNAGELLRRADEKLSKQPNTDSIRNLIIDEMVRIRDVLAVTHRDVRRLEECQAADH